MKATEFTIDKSLSHNFIQLGTHERARHILDCLIRPEYRDAAYIAGGFFVPYGHTCPDYMKHFSLDWAIYMAQSDVNIFLLLDKDDIKDSSSSSSKDGKDDIKDDDAASVTIVEQNVSKYVQLDARRYYKFEGLIMHNKSTVCFATTIDNSETIFTLHLIRNANINQVVGSFPIEPSRIYYERKTDTLWQESNLPPPNCCDATDTIRFSSCRTNPRLTKKYLMRGYRPKVEYPEDFLYYLEDLPLTTLFRYMIDLLRSVGWQMPDQSILEEISSDPFSFLRKTAESAVGKERFFEFFAKNETIIYDALMHFANSKEFFQEPMHVNPGVQSLKTADYEQKLSSMVQCFFESYPHLQKLRQLLHDIVHSEQFQSMRDFYKKYFDLNINDIVFDCT